MNWTLYDNNLRGSVRLGVAYGSPTRQVEAILCQAVNEQSSVHQSPPPTVIFDDFGDNALLFEVLFWTRISRPMDLRKLCSDIRFRIEELCHDAGIAIAFPQRDIHLDTRSPLRIQLTEAAGEP